ncbi:hypothetical protein A2U01_0090716, partial [Trifolium medium]|nr:hypothetical protein [Trifolium medium]
MIMNSIAKIESEPHTNDSLRQQANRPFPAKQSESSGATKEARHKTTTHND